MIFQVVVHGLHLEEVVHAAVLVGIVGLDVCEPAEPDVLVHLGQHALDPLVVDHGLAVELGLVCILERRFKGPAGGPRTERTYSRACDGHDVVDVAHFDVADRLCS